MSQKKALAISFVYMVGGIVIFVAIQHLIIADRRMANGLGLVAFGVYSLIVFQIAVWFKSRSQ